MYAAPPSPVTGFDPLRTVRLWLLKADSVPAVLPADMTVLPLRNDRVAVLSDFRSWLDSSHARYCQAKDGQASPECLAIRAVADRAAGPDFAFSNRPSVTFDYPPTTRIRGADESLVVPVVTTADVRDISVYSWERCPWTIGPTTNLDVELQPDKQHIRIRGRAGATGWLSLDRHGASCIEEDTSPPCLMEMRPEDPPVLNTAAISD
jgi:hypothetical protein